MIIFVAAAELIYKDQRSSEQHCIGRFLDVEENIDAQQDAVEYEQDRMAKIGHRVDLWFRFREL